MGASVCFFDLLQSFPILEQAEVTDAAVRALLIEVLSPGFNDLSAGHAQSSG
jgi:hypothetical protein